MITALIHLQTGMHACVSINSSIVMRSRWEEIHARTPQGWSRVHM